MKKLLWSTMVFIFVGLILTGCRQQTTPPIELKTTPAREATPAPKAGWEKKWETILAEAIKEGSVTVYAIWPSQLRIALTQAFKSKYGIDLEFSPFGRGSDLLAKVQLEKIAGLNIADIYGAGGPTLLATMKPAGVLGQLEPLLILPEVIDAKSWLGERVPFMDNDKLAIAMVGAPSRFTLYNTDLIKEGEIVGYKDVLNPRYKGKITLNDPTITGNGNALISHLAHNVWNLDAAAEFLKQLIRQQEVVIQRDTRLHVESVARGKFAIGLGPNQDNAVELFKAGAPIKLVIHKEGTTISGGAGSLAVSTRPSHPNATRVFVNWMLSKEGQTIFPQAFGNPSLRTDVSTEGFFPVYLPQPGEKIYPDSEEYILFRGKMLEIIKNIIEEAKK